MMQGDSFTCPCCRIRYTIGAPIGKDPPHEIAVPYPTMRLLRSFALEFDEAAGDDRYTAMEFMDYLEPSVRGSEKHRNTLSITSLQPPRRIPPGEVAGDGPRSTEAPLRAGRPGPRFTP